MSDLKFNIDAAEIAAMFKELAMEVQQDLEKGVQNLAAMTDAKTKEMAQAGLKTSRETYIENLTMEEVAPGVWVVSLDEPALWIEEGLPEHDMKKNLLKNAKQGKNGISYKVIPFHYGSAPTKLTDFAQKVVKDIRRELKQDNIPFKTIEKTPEGSPKIGILHRKDYGGEIPGKGNTPVMDGLAISQRLDPNTGNVRRDILTFRTVSSGPGSANKWMHPGTDPKKFMDKAFEWAIKEWEDKILPDILKKYE